MSITITGGISFGGGVGITAAPPTTATAGWFAGGYYAGYNFYSTVNRVTFATDTATATSRGSLSQARQLIGGTGTFTYGWFAGGRIPGSPGPNGTMSIIDRITYATDTGTASVRGAFGGNYGGIAEMGVVTDGTTYGWWGGGYTGGQARSFVARLIFATDTNATTFRGPLATIQQTQSGVSNANDGWFGGGYLPSTSTFLSLIQRINYATDTATGVTKGPMTIQKSGLAGNSDNSTYGWFSGGSQNSTPSGLFSGDSTIQRITYANDTVAATVRGTLVGQCPGISNAGTGNTTDGWIAGGGYSGSSAVQRITYATDTASSSIRGPLTWSVKNTSSAAGVQ